MTRPLLIELFTEELPPKALSRISEAFAQSLLNSLVERGLAEAGTAIERFATPRRLAVRIARVLAHAPERTVEAKGPSVKVDSTRLAHPRRPSSNGLSARAQASRRFLAQATASRSAFTGAAPRRATRSRSASLRSSTPRSLRFPSRKSCNISSRTASPM